MRNCILQSLFAPKKRLLLLIILCFTTFTFSNAQNLLSSNNNNPGFEGIGGFQTNGYTDISPGTSGTSSNGNYALTGSSGPMNTSSFNNVLPHSGSKMMVIDANNDIFWKQNPNIQLQGGVKYTFSYWVININKNGTSNAAFPNPVIVFNALDQCSCTPVLKSGSATVNNAAWQQVIYEFTPSGTGAKWVRIELSTPAATPNGNDFAIDDLSLTEPPLPLSISTSQTAISCPGLNDGSVSAYGFGGVQPYSYKLTPSVGLAITNSTGIFTNLAAGTYKVEVFDANSPVGSASKNVTINSVLDMTIAASIPANAMLVPATSTQPLNTTICAGNTITLAANNMVGYTWSSTPMDPSLSVPNSASIAVTPTVNTVYKVTATGPTGALGNLVYNGDFENDVAGFSSDYKYLATNPAFEKRTYGVIANPNTWGSVYDSAQDHTNPGIGKFFITDGSTSTPIIDKVWGQNIAVKPGITYDFNYFLRTITSTFPLLPAKMQLKINGVIINNTASSPTDVAPATTAGGWVSYKHTWTAGVGVTVAVIELYDIETNGSGNDFGLDDITFIPQGSGTCTVSKEITVNVSPGTSDTSFTYPTLACQSATTFMPTKTTPATFTTGGVWSKSSAGGTLSINSSTGEINPSLSTTGIFTVKYEVLQNLSICQAASSSTFDITINPQPDAGTSGNTTVCESSAASINLYSLITGEQSGGTWTRTTGTGGVFNAVSGTFTPAVGATTSTFTYTLTGASPCINSTSIATVNINPQPVAGTSGSTTVCESSSTSINLYSLLTGEQSGGTWTRTTGTGGTFNAASGTFTPAVGATTSAFTYTLTGTSPCINSSSVATVNVNPQPDAGTSGNTTVCESSAASINLYSLITGEQSGGTWTRTTGTGGMFNAASGTFTPAVGATTSTFTYTLTGASPCINSTSIATVNINPQPVAGTSGSTTVCESSSAPINLSSLITGAQTGGTWTKTTGTGGTFNAASGTFTPAVGATTSTFTYTLAGTSPCINSTSIATININPQPVAGTSGSTTVCESSSTSINLYSLVTGEQSGGTWTRTTGTGGTFNAASGTFTPAVGATTSAFTYTLTGTSPCINSSSVATVNVNPQPDAGTSGNITVCESSAASINLYSLITGEQAGGIWTRTTGTGGTFNAASGTFTPAVGTTTSTFTYTLTGASPCINSTSIATVNINPQPVAGTSGNTTVCESSSTPINLYSLITGEQSGGTWTRTTGTGGAFNAASGTFTPAVGSTTSTFTYTLTGTSPCVNSTSIATVNINPQPVAGTSGNTTVCESSSTPINLSSLITGAQSGGTWTRATGTGGVFNAASATFTPALGATTSTFTYTLIGSSPCVNSTSVATVNINPVPMLSINCGAPSTSSVTFNWNAISGATSYNYSYSVDSSAPITGSVSGTTLIINSLLPGQNVAITVASIGNTCVTTGSGNCVSSNCPTPTVDPISDITTICANGTVTVPSFTSTPVGATFSWASNNTTIGIAANGTGNIPSFTAINATAIVQTAVISVTASDATCTGPASNFKISINPLPTVSISGTTSVCSGTGTNVAFSGTPNATVTYTVNGGSNQTIILDAAGSAVVATGNLIANAVYDLVSVLNSATSCSQVQSGTVTISINPLPTVSISGTTSVCSGTGTNITFTGTPNATVTYTVNGGSNQTVVLDASGSAVLPTGNLMANTVYSLVSVLNLATSCSQVQSGTATISINPLPTVSISGTTSVCSGAGTNITFTGTPNATVTYSVNGGSNQIVVLDASGSAVLPTGNLTANAVYSLVSVLNSATNCSQVQSGTATISINSLPTVSISGTTSVCSGTGTNVTFSGTPNATVTYSVNGGSDQTIILDTAGSAVLPTGNLSANTVYGLVSVLNSATSCSQVQSGTATISINSLPTVSISGTASVCSGTGTNVTFSGTPNATVTYTVNGGINQSVVLGASGSAVVPTGNLIANTVYSLVSVLNSATACSQVQSGTATISINPLPTVSISGTTPVCSGTGTNITFTGTPNATVTYTVNGGSNQAVVLDASGSAVLPTGNLIANTVYSLVSVLNSVTSCSQVQSGTATISINPLPTVSISGTTSVCSGAGTNITFTGTPNATVTYSVNGGSNQIVVLDASGSAVLPTGNLTANAVYSLVSVLNSATNCSQVQSGTATISINSLPTVSISGTTSVCSGTGTNVTFSGTPNATVTYSVNGGSDQTIILDAAGSAVVATGNLTATAVYSLVSVLNSATSCSQVQSGTATISINSLPTVSISGTASVCSGTGTNVTFSGTPNATVTYTVNGGINQSVVLGASGSAVVPTGNLIANTVYSLVSVLNSATACSQVQSGTVTISINPLPTVSISGTTSVCSGTGTNITFTGTPNATVTYTVNGGSNQTIILDAAGSAVVPTGNLTATAVYSLVSVLNSATSCSQVQSGTVTINVNPLPIADFTGSTAICSGNSTAIVLSSTILGTTFSWNAVENNVTGASSNNGNAINQVLTVTGSNLGQVVYNVTPVMGNCIGLQKMITINVSPVPNVIENSAKKILCSGETTSIDLSSVVVGTTFSWVFNAIGVTGAASGTGNKIKQLLSNVGFVPGTVDYVITPSVNGCMGTPVTVTITVNPLPEVLGTPLGKICSKNATNIALSPTIAGTTFDWTAAQLGVTGAIDGTGNVINQILEATGSSQGNVTYTITPTLNGCIGLPLAIVVKVDPSPKPILMNGVICVEEATGVAYKTFTLDSGLSASNNNFQWYFNSLPITGATSSVFEATQFGDYKVQATDNNTGCDATSEIAKVIASYPGLAISTTQTLAFTDNATVEVTVTGGNAVFEYQLDDGSFQSSNVFNYLKSGSHTITVVDTNGCTNLRQDFFIIGYPKFFSPNGDGHNDTWNVLGLEGQPTSNIFIFDRYGKLIKQISPTGEGWDGTYMGQPLPATDYWFTVDFIEQTENKTFKAHFSLIR